MWGLATARSFIVVFVWDRLQLTSFRGEQAQLMNTVTRLPTISNRFVNWWFHSLSFLILSTRNYNTLHHKINATISFKNSGLVLNYGLVCVAQWKPGVWPKRPRTAHFRSDGLRKIFHCDHKLWHLKVKYHVKVEPAARHCIAVKINLNIDYHFTRKHVILQDTVKSVLQLTAARQSL